MLKGRLSSHSILAVIVARIAVRLPDFSLDIAYTAHQAETQQSGNKGLPESQASVQLCTTHPSVSSQSKRFHVLEKAQSVWTLTFREDSTLRSAVDDGSGELRCEGLVQ